MIDAVTIASEVERAISTIAVELRSDVRDALVGALETERSARARSVLSKLAENAAIASSDRVPLCQDTGTVWVWVELGSEEHVGAELYARINEAVARAYSDGGLRMSVARDALFDRSNTEDNTPAFVDVTFRPGTGATVHVMLKGGGSDNASTVAMLPPGAGEDGVIEFVVEHIERKGASACPPLIVGVGVGGTFDTVAKFAKRALLTPVGIASGDVVVAAFEKRLLDAINATGVGPAGLGGDTTALSVHVNTAPCHIAALPVAVNLGCSAMRSVSIDVS